MLHRIPAQTGRSDPTGVWTPGRILELQGMGVCEVISFFDRPGETYVAVEDAAGQQHFLRANATTIVVRSEEPSARLFRQLRAEIRKSRAPERRAIGIVDAWAAVLPARISREDLGDYVEDIHRRCAAGQRWCVYLRVVAAIFWTGLNAIGYAMKTVGKRSVG